MVTVLVVPHTELKPWRWQCSAGFLLFCLLAWSGLTLLAGLVVGRRVDYWVTKADNEVMRAKLVALSGEMDRARATLAQASSTDRQLRQLLSMARRSDDADLSSGVGGPTAADRRGLRQLLETGAVRQPDWHRQIEAIRRESLKRLASFQEISWYLSNQRSLYRATPDIWPTKGAITALFGYRLDPMARAAGEPPEEEFHPGIDIANAPDTLIRATADGTVRFSGWARGYGKMIVIDHGYGLSTVYAHASKTLVRAGERVSRGQVIAYMGTTGRSTGAHLHYEVWRHDKPVNPMAYLHLR